jgi:hypothetical protein
MVAPGGATHTNAMAGAEAPNTPATTAVAIANADKEHLVITISSSVFHSNEQVTSISSAAKTPKPRRTNARLRASDKLVFPVFVFLQKTLEGKVPLISWRSGRTCEVLPGLVQHRSLTRILENTHMQNASTQLT